MKEFMNQKQLMEQSPDITEYTRREERLQPTQLLVSMPGAEVIYYHFIFIFRIKA